MAEANLADLRAELARRGLDGFLVPRADEHLGEYVPPAAERLAWLTGFTGSAGMAVVLAQRAALFVDGRYVLQAAAQSDAAVWERRHITEEPPPAWIAAAAPGARIGYDPWLIAEEGLRRFLDAGLTLVATEPNPIDTAWHDRPGPPLHPAEPHPLPYAGRSSAEKRAEIAAALRAAQQDAAVITDPASLAWLLNIRGSDVPFTPFALGFALVHADAGVELFMDGRKLPPPTRAWLGNGVGLAERAALPGALAALAGKRVRVDPAGAPVWFAERLRAAGAEVAAGADPCLLPKACKNPVEQEGARAAHRRDAGALVPFLHWLEAAAGQVTEADAAAKLLELRASLPDFRGESFPAIVGAGEHGAIIHYRVTPETDRPIRADELFLIDSGAQFPEGTTDVTRTVWTGTGRPPAELCDRFTRVLKGHIAIATLVFPQGVQGAHLDAFARHALWQAGLDYDHGTGHGVGSYLSVHEGPVSLSRLARPVPLAAGMILSDEPGFYAPGRFGMRLENLLMVQPAPLPEASRPFLRFETLTLAPFDRRLIAPALLTPAEIAWIDAYHARVLAEVGPGIAGGVRAWLAAACAPLGFR
ncbi:MAG: aminopeptidase P family protein [Alphaproteobacteria bacterium]|nr:aminopeptidase P family protein [Alphaproteobacteria bacterium]